MTLMQRQVVITGAGSGLGRAFAEIFASEGSRLILSDINPKGLEETVQLCKTLGATDIKSVTCDVSQLSQVQSLAQHCTGPLDLLINNAGIATSGEIGTQSIEDWKATIDVNLWGVIHGCHVFVPLFKRQGFGHILNVASAAGLVHPPLLAAYNVTKAGVVALSESLSLELVSTKIGVTVLCPGFFQTQIVENARYTDPHQRELGRKLLARGPTADRIAREAIRAMRKRKLYCVLTPEAHIQWRIKRLSPALNLMILGLFSKIAKKYQKS